MKIKITKRYINFPVGAEVEMSDANAAKLIKLGVAVPSAAAKEMPTEDIVTKEEKVSKRKTK